SAIRARPHPGAAFFLHPSSFILPPSSSRLWLCPPANFTLHSSLFSLPKGALSHASRIAVPAGDPRHRVALHHPARHAARRCRGSVADPHAEGAHPRRRHVEPGAGRTHLPASTARG